jgi:hypothetical protein
MYGITPYNAIVFKIMLPLPRLHQRDKHVEAITFRRVAFSHHQALDLFRAVSLAVFGNLVSVESQPGRADAGGRLWQRTVARLLRLRQHAT